MDAMDAIPSLVHLGKTKTSGPHQPSRRKKMHISQEMHILCAWTKQCMTYYSMPCTSICIYTYVNCVSEKNHKYHTHICLYMIIAIMIIFIIIIIYIYIYIAQNIFLPQVTVWPPSSIHSAEGSWHGHDGYLRYQRSRRSMMFLPCIATVVKTRCTCTGQYECW